MNLNLNQGFYLTLTFKGREVDIGVGSYNGTKRMRIKWESTESWSAWKTWDSQDDIKTFIHTFNNIQGSYENKTIWLEFVYYNSTTITNVYGKTITMKIFPAPDENAYNNNQDELTIFNSNKSIREPILVIEGFETLRSRSKVSIIR